MEPLATQSELESLAHLSENEKAVVGNGDREKNNLGIQVNDVSPRLEPKNWAPARKWTATLLLSAFAFLQPLSETMLSPVEKNISKALHITQAYEWLLVNSLILIGIGLAPLVLAPLSEVYGRKPVLIVGSIVFVVWNTGCGAARTLGQMLAFRLLSGFGASVADALAGGVMGDLWRAEERGKAFAVFMAAPLLGPAIGPICGAFISEGIDWRWVFWIISIASAVTIALAVVFLRETYLPKLQQLDADKRSKTSGGGGTVEAQDRKEKFLMDMRVNLQRPLRMLTTQVIIQLLAGYMSILYGTMFLFLFMYPTMWTRQYGQSVGIGSLNYISFAIGLIIGVTIAGRLSDRVYTRLKARSGGVGRPEYRIPTMALGTALVPVGLLWWGWSGEARVHWVVPNLGSLVFAAGIYMCSTSVSVYTIDAYTQYAASAVSTNLVARSLSSALFPLFAPYMFNALGFGLGATALACGFVVIGTGVVVILWFYGDRLRARSPYCAAETED
ncbi:hypothetical protein KVR01_009183 [Diaporthe batatas]|uniref:uncharacterized protein n=1 Tax=Diaporthe batatas TaxID=748121 RepID=UPI001D0506FB|nr:uncharacterized protein KVR01_009183 [Diaporthe batatas]KAG8160919.1 hypothetical protein KVR01_009183 [Diaporthe batatas]